MKTYSKDSRFQVALLYFTSILGTLLGVVASIVNTHYLYPEEYGDVRYVQNVINFISTFLLFGYFWSGSRLLAISNHEMRNRQIRGTMILILLVAYSFLILCMIVCSIFFKAKLDLSTLFLVSIPVCAFPILNSYVNTTAQGDNHIVRLALTRITPALLYVILSYVIYEYTGASPIKMMLLQWGIYTLVIALIIISTKPVFRGCKSIFREMRIENKEYGFQLYIGSLIMVASNYLAGISLGAFNNDNSEVGFYTLALSVTGPLSLIPGVIGTTYFKKFATLPSIPTKVLKWSLLITIITCLLFVIVIKPMVVFLYSEKYSVVGIYASWLSVGFCLHGFGDMINRYLGSHGRGKEIRNSSIVCGVFKIIGYTFLVYFLQTEGALLTNIICNTIYCCFLIYYYKRYISTNARNA